MREKVIRPDQTSLVQTMVGFDVRFVVRTKIFLVVAHATRLAEALAPRRRGRQGGEGGGSGGGSGSGM